MDMNAMLRELKKIHQQLLESVDRNQSVIQKAHKSYLPSIQNLVQYRELRKTDISGLQQKLYSLSLSSLDLEMFNVEKAIARLIAVVEKLKGSSIQDLEPHITNARIEVHKEELFGSISNKRSVRIMVTLPSEAAYDYNLVRSFVFSGMNVARINCAHDSSEKWTLMISNVKKAEVELGKQVKIAMDLAGPKIRTGSISSPFSVKKISPTKNEIGELISPYQVVLKSDKGQCWGFIKVSNDLIAKADLNDEIICYDPRGKKRILKVIDKGVDFLKVEGDKTTYFRQGAHLRLSKEKYYILDVPSAEPFLLLKKNDVLRLDKEFDHNWSLESSNDHSIPSISCTLPEIIDDTKLGESIFFDDGKIEGFIEEKNDDHVKVRIKHAKIKGSKLRANKGINFPDSNLTISGLTQKDKSDLKFICAHADIVNFSFVNTKVDVKQLMKEIKLNNRLNTLGIILKIETAKAFDNLPEILETAMQTRPIGVMVARGDLAVEVGWKKLGSVIKEILYMCNAAHVPTIWATQVLEGLSKNGTPTRSEIIDAVISSNSSCIMLNKGPYIIDAIKLLNELIKQFEMHRHNDFVLFDKLKKLKPDPNEKHLRNAQSPSLN